MSNLSTRYVVAALALAMLGTAQAAPETVTITAAAASQLPPVDASDRRAVAGHYQMSDGRTLALSPQGSYWLQVALDGVPVQTVRARRGELTTADGSMTLRFNRDRDDTVIVTLSMLQEGKAQTLASVAPHRAAQLR